MWIELSFGTALLIVIAAMYVKSKAVQQVESDDGDVLAFSSTSVPGLDVKNTIGYIESSSVMPTEGDYSTELAEETTVQKLKEKAKALGANAILELSIEKQEHAMHIKIIARGLAVQV